MKSISKFILVASLLIGFSASIFAIEKGTGNIETKETKFYKKAARAYYYYKVDSKSGDIYSIHQITEDEARHHGCSGSTDVCTFIALSPFTTTTVSKTWLYANNGGPILIGSQQNL